MKRSILLSLLVVGVAATLLAVAGTQALFSDSQTASGDVDAGTINLRIEDGINNDGGPDANAEGEFIFEGSQALLPGGSVSHPLVLQNIGTSAWKITSLTFANTGAECDAGNLGDDFSAGLTSIAVGDVVPAGGSESGSVNVSLASGAGNPCQGATFSVVLTVDVGQP